MKLVVALGIATALLVLVGLATVRIGSDCGPGTRTEFILHSMQAACALYQRDYGAYPAEDADGGVVALTAALTSPSKAGNPILDASWVGDSKRLEDGWGKPLCYRLVEKRPHLRSAGPDGVFETPDYIVLTK